MAMFSYLYFNSYVAREVGVTVGSVLSAAMQVLACLLQTKKQTNKQITTVAVDPARAPS